jgi:hypothetical protein
MKSSELVAAITSIKADHEKTLAVRDAPPRSLSQLEVERLEAAGNVCPDWSRVRVGAGFDCNRVRNCRLQGDVILGQFTRPVKIFGNVELLAGLENSTLVDCIVGNDAFIHDVGLLAHCVVGEEGVIANCGTICCEGQTTYGVGKPIAIGVETGGRDVLLYPEIDIEVAAAVACQRGWKDFLEAYGRAVREYMDRIAFDRTIIARGAVIRSTPTVRNCFIGPRSRIDAAGTVTDSTLLSSVDEPVEISFGAHVAGSLLQWGSRVTTMALVDRSVLMEHSHAEQHGKVMASIIGPNSGIARGEVTSSLVGPFVAMHHESLLIATVWPEGRGNVSYGAMAGANHTSKAPDQEFFPGEGIFLGLGSAIRFPADLSRAPYTVFASNVTALPQKVLFPFSLINLPGAHHLDIPPAYNEIFPAWMLTDNMYALRRSEAKYRSRNKARRAAFDFRIFRPAIIDLMADACKRLQAVTIVKPLYTDAEIPGTGKNYLTEASRVRAIDGYRFYIRYYALLALKQKAETMIASGYKQDLDQLLCRPQDDSAWEHARQALEQDADIRSVKAGLDLLSNMLEEVAHSVERSKAKDDERGVRIIDDYASVHVEAANDPVVRQTWDETRRLQHEITELCRLL